GRTLTLEASFCAADSTAPSHRHRLWSRIRVTLCASAPHQGGRDQRSFHPIVDTGPSMTSPQPGRTRPLLLVGMPRSGTTWTMRVLASDPSLLAVMEPDNEVRSAPAIWAKRGSGRF